MARRSKSTSRTKRSKPARTQNARLTSAQKNKLARLHKQKPKTPLAKLRKQIEIARIEGPAEPAKGKSITHIKIPATQKKVERFARLAEQDVQGFNNLKAKDEYFAFTIEGNQSRTIFKDVGELVKMLRAYLKSGTAKGARFELVKVHGTPAQWKAARRAKTASDTQRAIKNYRRRRSHRLKKIYKGQPYEG